MIFSGDLFDAVLDGRKTVTRRAVSTNPRSPWAPTDGRPDAVAPRGFKVGRDYAIEPSRTAAGHPEKRIKIVATSLEPLASVGREGEAEREGFAAGRGPCTCDADRAPEPMPHAADCTSRRDLLALERFIERWSELHGDFDATLPVWRVEFILVDRG